MEGIAAPSDVVTSVVDRALLGDWTNAAVADSRTLTIDHRYTQEGLSADKLKGIDRARANVLFEAAEQADCVAHLALVTLWQSGAAEEDYDDYSYGRGRRYHWSDEDD